jgi:hypothetical protein
MTLTSAELTNVHEASHAVFARSHGIEVEQITRGCTYIPSIFRRPSPAYLGLLVAGGMGASLVTGAPYNMAETGNRSDTGTMTDLVPKQFGAVMVPVIDHTEKWLKRPAVWRVVQAMALALDTLNGHLTGTEIVWICRELELPTCRTCPAPGKPLAPRRLARSGGSKTPADAMHDLFRKQDEWRRKAWKSLSPQQRQTALKLARSGGLGLGAPLHFQSGA